MRKLLLLVLTITASVAFASPPVQDENLPDQVVKVPVVEKEPTVEHTEEEAGPLMEDEAVADSRMVEPDSEETQVMLEEPVLEADYLAEETKQEPELEITAIQTNKNNMSVEESVAELESETNKTNEKETNAEIQMEPGRGSRRTHNGWWSCKGVFLQGKCYQYIRINVDAYRAEFPEDKADRCSFLFNFTKNCRRKLKKNNNEKRERLKTEMELLKVLC
ncbi:hypothetical protein Q8A67_006652 [Cirrhinus molitorella]|uniref:Uncharacterized protein n=1 Tax=Cirrhinus molitorella TaxID=172907 RepID=A0AA88PZ15_9TELE|nr:hypothetical protein Q8A67_006652 [Cirrhinus molitorella]